MAKAKTAAEVTSIGDAANRIHSVAQAMPRGSEKEREIRGEFSKVLKLVSPVDRIKWAIAFLKQNSRRIDKASREELKAVDTFWKSASRPAVAKSDG